MALTDAQLKARDGRGRRGTCRAARAVLVPTLLAVLAVLSLAAAAPTRAAPASRDLRVGLVLASGIRDPWDRALYRGLARAVRELGVEGHALTAGPREGSLPTFAYFARRGYDLVIASSPFQAADLDIAAREYPGVKFLLVDPSAELPHRHPNVQGTLFKVEEAAYLAGYLAALTERSRPGPEAVSSVGGARVPPVDRFIAGFQAGARRAVPGIRTLNAYANSYLVPARCRSIALRQIARGSGVVFPVAGLCGRGALAAAREQRRFGIGVDVDQSGLGPHVLTSVVKRLDLVVFRAVVSLRGGRFRGGVDRVYGLRNGGVDLGRISGRVPRGLVARLAAVRRQIATGQLSVPTRLRRG